MPLSQNYFYVLNDRRKTKTSAFFLFKSNAFRSTRSRAVLTSKLVNRRYRVHSMVALVDLVVVLFSETREYGLGSFRKTPSEGSPSVNSGPICGQLALILQPNPNAFHKIVQFQNIYIELSTNFKVIPFFPLYFFSIKFERRQCFFF